MRSATDRAEPLVRDEVLAEGSTRRMAADVRKFFSRERLEQAAAVEERARLARELHDGILQSLSGATLQLELIARLIELDASTAQTRLREVARTLSEQQSDLRRWIDELRPAEPRTKLPPAELAAALEKLCRRAAWQYGVRVDLKLPDSATLPRVLAEHIYRIVQEGLTNMGRHARAQAASVDLRIDFRRAELTICDDGVGFPFHGNLDLPDLMRRGVGPRSLKDRVAALRGEMNVTSSSSGSHLLIRLPIDGR
jgi:signal transduction histidine kinase